MKTYTTFLTVALTVSVSILTLSVTATKHIVLVGNFYFNPSGIPDVVVGDTIRWEWVEGMHTTTSTVIPTGAASWNSPISSSVQVFEYRVTVPGTYNYKCTPHSSIQTGSFVATGFTPTLTVNPLNQNVNASAGDVSFLISSNTSWTAASNHAWCTVTPASGTGNGTLTATYDDNPDATIRVAEISVQALNGPVQSVTVTQDGAGLAVENRHSDAFRVFPNPTSGIFTIIPGNVSNLNMEVTITNLNGQVVHSAILSGNTSYRLDITSFHDGIYFVRLRDGEKALVRRIIKSD